MNFNRAKIFAAAAAIATFALSACGGGGDRQTSATAAPSAAAPAPTPDQSGALNVSLMSATIVGTPTPQNMVPVRVLYTVRVDAPTGITSAYGFAALPYSPKCDGGAAAAIAEGPLPRGATVEHEQTFYCDPDDATNIGRYSGYSMTFTASTVTFQSS